jgi:hypothetical protein
MREAHVIDPETGANVVTVPEEVFAVEEPAADETALDLDTFAEWVTRMEHAGFTVDVVE